MHHMVINNFGLPLNCSCMSTKIFHTGGFVIRTFLTLNTEFQTRNDGLWEPRVDYIAMGRKNLADVPADGQCYNNDLSSEYLSRCNRASSRAINLSALTISAQSPAWQLSPVLLGRKQKISGFDSAMALAFIQPYCTTLSFWQGYLLSRYGKE